jgi:hypothetical protein
MSRAWLHERARIIDSPARRPIKGWHHCRFIEFHRGPATTCKT